MKDEKDFVIQCEGDINRLYEEVHTLGNEKHTLCKVELITKEAVLQLVAPLGIYNRLIDNTHVYVEYGREGSIILYAEVIE